MQSLLSEAGRGRLDEIVRAGVLCAFDFDGTLAPIMARPEQVHLPEQVRERLVGLRRLAPVAIITGRSVDDIRSRLGFEPDFTVGNHGLEGVPGQEAETLRHEALCSGWRATLEQALRDGRFDDGVFIEDKRYSLSVHYRAARDTKQAALTLEAFLKGMQPAPRIVAGKAIYSLMPQDGGHKGSALERLMQVSGAPGAIYVGDDVTDEDVFRLHRRDVLTVRVEPSPDTAAEFFLPHLQDVDQLLQDLIMRLQAAGAG